MTTKFETALQFLKKHKRKILLYGLLLFCLPFALLFILFFLVRFGLICELPGYEELSSIKNPEASELYADGGELIAKYFTENRTSISLPDLNQQYRKALIATEDIRFYDHNGVDFRSLARVFLKTILMMDRSSGGGSTITQQVVKNTFPRERFKMFSSVINKFREMIIARRMEKVYSKNEILLLYSNTVSFGEGAFGIESASKRFFNKSAKELELNEAATLVGMLKAPTYYSPRRFPERAQQRRNVVLAQMAKYGFIEEALREEESAIPLEIDYQKPSNKNEFARYFKNQVKKEFEVLSKFWEEDSEKKLNIYTDGLKIYSSLNLDLQIAAENTMQAHMSALQKQFNESWKGARMFGPGTKVIDDHIKRTQRYKRLKASGISSKEILDRITQQQELDLWDWSGQIEKSGTMIDSIKHYLGLLHTGILAVEPGNGFVKAWVGGNDYNRFQYDRIREPRQVGSTFKPIVYLTALEQGIEVCDTFPNELRNYTSYKDWTPKNANGEYGGVLTLIQALINSVNTVSVQVLFKAGIQNVVEQAKRMGIENHIAEVPSIVLGTPDISLYEMVNAYACLANGGMKPELSAIRKIEDRDGNVLYERDTLMVMKKVAEPENVEILNQILHQVNIKGTGRRMYNQFQISEPIAGKTGTTQNQSDGWYIGYTPELVVGAWVGTEDRRIHFRYLGHGAGSNTALPMVAGVFEYFSNLPSERNNYDDITNIEDCIDGPKPEFEFADIIRVEEDGRVILFPDKNKSRKGTNSSKTKKSNRIKSIEKQRKKIKDWLDKLKKKDKRKRRN